jgi:DNA modification methylase
VCGDCTDKEVVNAVAFGNIDLIVSDPPYSVSYADKNKSLNAVAFGNRIQTPIENDHLSTEETASKIWLPAFKNMYDIAKPGCAYYVSAPQGGDQMMMMMMLVEAGWLVKHELIWVKNNHVLGRADYQYKHEPIIYGWKPGAGHYFIDSRSEVSTWEIDKPLNSDLHPTQKPLELVERAIRNSSRQGEIVADFFVGSGTTLIGCQKLGRRCMAIDSDPAYCAVTLQRWHDLTGLDPQRID